MAKTKLSEYSATAASNTDINSINIDEGMSPSNVNNAIRELMAQLKNMEDGTDAVTAIKSGNIQITSNTISSTDTNGNINITPNGNGNVVLDGINYPQADGTANYFLKTDGAGQLSFAQVDTASIAADAIDGTKIADDSIDSEHYVDGSIDAAHIADNAVGATQLNVSGSGTSGQVLSSDGDGTFSWADAGGGLKLLLRQDIESSTTWTKLAATNLIRGIFGGAAGGGGGSGNGTYDAAAGGGGAGAVWFEVGANDVTTNVTVTIGAAGAGAVNPESNGSAGGTSSFGNYVTINGGNGGGYFAGGGELNTATVAGTGGVGSTNFSVGGNINYVETFTGGTGAYQNVTYNGLVNATANNVTTNGFLGRGGTAYSKAGGYYGGYTGDGASGGVMLFSGQNMTQSGGGAANNSGSAGSVGRLIIEQYGDI